jgi:hypothetical protein
VIELDASISRAAGLRSAFAGAAPAYVVALAAAWISLRGIDHHFISFSDGVYTYIASRIAARGAHELYGSIVLSQPPGVVLGASGLWRLSPHVETMRLALALLGGVTALLTYALARANKLNAVGATAAAVVALTAPIHGQFSGLDGEAFLAPLALVLALALERKRPGTAGALAGAGLFFKLTWAPFLIATLVVAAKTGGRKAVARAGLAAVGCASLLYASTLLAFGWSPRDLVSELLLGESGSGFQLHLMAGIVLVTLLLWWPLLPITAVGGNLLGWPTRALLVASLTAFVFTVKQGTFFNVLDPAEPFLAIAALAGAAALWQRRTFLARGLVAICAMGLALHVVSLTGTGQRRLLPFPVGAAFVRTDDESDVDRATLFVRRHSDPSEAVLVNPLFAVLADRKEVRDQADWFILDALARSCPGTARSTCLLWADVKNRARANAVVVSVDSNVTSFDPAFGHDLGLRSHASVLLVISPPIDTELYARR